MISANQSCMRDSTSFVQAFVACNGFVGLNPGGGLEPLPIDSAKVFLEYPQNIKMVGFSFNTNIGKWSLAGEYSLRPDMPLQVDTPDLLFAALQPAFPRQDLNLGANLQTITQNLSGRPAAIGQITTTNPAQLVQSLTALGPALTPLLGAAAQGGIVIPGSRTAVPDFVSGYRGFQVTPNERVSGAQRLIVDQIDLTGIRAIGSSENPFGAEQIIVLTEFGFTHIWNMPNRSQLQLEGGDNNNTHASPGADGSGWPAGTPPATYTHTLNPTQQSKGFASSFSCGYRTLVTFEYDNLLWEMNFKPYVRWQQDLAGIAPLPIQNFVAGTKFYETGTYVESGQQWSGQIYYQGTTGGGSVNTQRDRDTIGLAINYTF